VERTGGKPYRGAVRSLLGLAAAWVVVAVGGASAGCAGEAAPAAQPRPAPLRPTSLPAATAGGACRLLDYAVLDKTLGARFDVAAASRDGETRTCVVQAEKADLPDLLLAVSPTKADAAVFRTDVVPKGGKAVKGLGAAAYQLVAAVRGAGPAAEVGWLSRNGRIMTMRFTFAPGKSTRSATAMVPRLVTLAKQLDAVDV
jgi:hypothetical protein